MIFDKFIKFFKKQVIEANIAIIDDSFPQKKPVGFRNIEINTFLNDLDDCKSYTMYPMLPSKEAWFKHGYGVKYKVFKENKKSYLKYYPENKDKIFYLEKFKKYKFNLAYSYFLAQTFTLLPFYEKNKIPFIFTLYCGGGFGINNKKIDKMLEIVFSSKYFKKVLVDQAVVYDYLIEKKLCQKEKISFLRCGAPVQFNKNDILSKKFYKKDKNTFDIGFVGFKYSELGKDKGYDLFIETAKHFCKTHSDVHFHVVGNFDENVIDVSDIKDNITFYGIQTPDFLKTFYTKIDICISPNRPFILYEGSFDGFPLQKESMYMGSLLMCTDELNNNRNLFTNDEIVIIKPDINNILEKLEYFYNNVETMYRIAKNGQTKAIELFDYKKRVDSIKFIIQDILKEKK